MVANYNPIIILTLKKSTEPGISNSPGCGTLFKDKRVIRFRRLPNLRDMLTHASIKYPHTKEILNPSNPTICTKLGKCTNCLLMEKLGRITCYFTHKSYKTIDLPKHINLEISNGIYLIICTKCHMHDVGETSRTLRKRMYEHKASV